MMRKISGIVGKLDVIKTAVINKISDAVDTVKENAVVVGSGVIAVILLFAIANVFVDVLGLYVGLLIGFTVITNLINWIQGNKEEIA
jgi:hypothetical protein